MALTKDEDYKSAAGAVHTDTVTEGEARLELVVGEGAQVMVFHTKPFRRKLSWFEFDVNNSRMNLIFNDGDMRDFGLPIPPSMNKKMHNAHQVLVVLMDEETGEPSEGFYFPLIIHQI